MSPENISGHHFSTLLLLFIFFHIPFSHSSQLQSLLTFKSSLQNSNSPVFDSWHQQNHVCNFTGIFCDTTTNLVKEINLSGQNLSGFVSFDSICALESLEKISLGSNSLFGNITHHLSNCSNLHYLDLGLNSFSGEVPDLSSLTKLEFLSMNLSGFSGSFPWKSLENMTNLSFLSLGDNPFDKSPFPLEILKLEKLYWLYLSNCSIDGQIPDGIGNLVLLERIELADNNLFGEIPSGIGKLSKLQILELYDNKLTGSLPVGFKNLTSLVKFDVSNNSLEGNLTQLITLTRLESLQLFENNFSGEIPAEFGEFKFLQEFSVYKNKLTGPLPQKIGSWAGLYFIDVSENFLNGTIPPDMCKNDLMAEMLLLQNNFTGGIPETYANCSSLLRLRINNNSLSGVVPAGIWGLPKLSLLDLSMNQFEGPISPDIGEAKALAQIFLANNRFSGHLPEEFSGLSSLVEVEMNSNQFSGQVPANIGQLKRLDSLHLEDNFFSGTIPDSLGSCFSLTDLNLAGNLFSGKIPATLGTLPSLNSLNLSNNKLSGEIPASLSIPRLSLLDFSNNMLVGRVPEPLLIEAGSDSFTGNPGLCGEGDRNLRRCSPESGKTGELKTLIACFIAGACVAFVALSCFAFLKLRQNDHKDHPIKRGRSWDMKQFHVISFSEEEIVRSIKNENLIGKGGSGDVYKVVLKCGMELAVKHIWKSDSDDRKSCRSSSAILGKGKSRSPEYDAEVATLSSIRHVNVVKLFCSITSEDSNLLVYEYMPNGSLWDRLHTNQKIEMDWNVRYEIALGAARGLEYLHHGCDKPVIHRDVKSSNILLDENMKPKIADFGLAKIMQASGGMDSTQIIAGTHGYIAPEYAYTCKVKEKSDIYSFGVVLMELVTGKKPMEVEFGENKDIVHWVCSEMRNKDDEIDLVDSSISKVYKKDAAKVLRIAIQCTMKTPALRPSMRTVVQMLEDVELYSLSDVVIFNVEDDIKIRELQNHTPSVPK